MPRRSTIRPALRAALLLPAALTLLLAGIVSAYQLAHSGVVFRGVTVGGQPVGGLTREQALAVIQPRYQERAARSVSLRAGGAEWRPKLSDLGAILDPTAAAESAYSVGRTGGWLGRLSAQLRALTEGYRVEDPGLRVDRGRLEVYLAERAGEIDRPVRDARLELEPDPKVRLIPSVVGRRLDVATAVVAVENAVKAGVDRVDLPVEESRPARTEQDLEKARAQMAKMLSGPVVAEFEGLRWTLAPREVAEMVVLGQGPGSPEVEATLQEEPLRQLVDRMAGEIDQTRQNARLDWNGGNLRPLQPGRDGRKLDRAKALAMLKDALLADRRVVALPVEVDRAVGGSLNLSSLGIRDLVDSATTSFAGSVPEKAHNIKLAASRLNGVVLAPGEIFSFNRELGPTTLKSGFQTGFGIAVNNDGEMQTVPSVAGGICQVSTTLLHAVFWAGYQIEERYPHLYWIASYGVPPKGMIGLDATVDAPNLDFKFKNNTKSYLLIQSRVEGSTLEFALYGTKPDWKVEVEGPIITNVVKADPKAVRQEEPTMPAGKEIWVERATDGMDVEIVRRVTEGDDVRTLRITSPYQPSRNVLMVGTKKGP